jgi:transcriptional repressor NrdR
MRCPYCKNDDTKVVDKRDVEGKAKRRRECLKCEKRFNTLEHLEEIDLTVVKKDGRREDFDQDKLKRGIVIACQKRPVSTETIERMIATIQDKLRKEGKEVGSQVVGQLVSKELKRVDDVAYIRFASVYKDFSDAADFKRELQQL